MKLVVDTSYGKEFGFYISENEENSYNIDWGDGSSVKSEDVISNEVSHEYTGENTEYTVTISGVIKSLEMAYQKRANLIEIEQWGELGLTDLYRGFSFCTNLREIASPTKNSFKDVTNFRECFWKTGITNIPENLFANCPNVTSFESCFSHTEITSIPEKLFANCPNVTNFYGCFKETKITSIPENLFANCPNVTSFSWCFSHTEITSIPENLFKKFSNVSNFSYTFFDCSELEEYIPLWDSSYYYNGNNALNEGTMLGLACFAECDNIFTDDLSDDVIGGWFWDPPAM